MRNRLLVDYSFGRGLSREEIEKLVNQKVGSIEKRPKRGKRRKHISAALRETLLARQNSVCFYFHQCGIRFGNGVYSHLHHIDGDSSNNEPNNLMLLCPNHHDAITRKQRSQNRQTKSKSQFDHANAFDIKL